MALKSDLSMSFVRISSFGLEIVVEVTTRGHYMQNDPYFSLYIGKMVKNSEKIFKCYGFIIPFAAV